MKIKFDTKTVTEAEARAVVVMLVDAWGLEILTNSVLRAYIGTSPEDAAPEPYVLPEHRPAPDGYPAAPPPPADNAHVAEGCEPFPVSTDAPERDTDGIPWDARIHASTKTTNKDGTWTRRRNTPDETFDKVMAELKAANTAMTMAAAAGLTAPPVAPEPLQPTAAEAFTPPASVVIPAHVPAPPVPQPPAPPVPVAPTVDDKSAEAVEIMKAINAKDVKADKLAEVVGKAGLKGLAEVFTASIEARRIIAAELAAL